MLVAGAGTAVVGVGMYGDAATGCEDTLHFQIAWVHQPHEVFHNRVHAVLVEVAVVAEREQIQFQALAFHHPAVGYIHDAYLRKVGLSCDGAQRSEFRAEKLHPVVVVGMLVLKRLQHFGSIVGAV